MKRFYPYIIILFGFGLAGLLIVTGPTVEPRKPTFLPLLVRALDIELATVQLRTRTYGAVVPRTESELTAEVSGRVLAVSPVMVSGGFFTRGQELLRIDPLDYEVALEEARARMARSASDLANAKKAYARQLDLARKQSASAAQQDDALNRLRIAEATLRESGARLKRAKRGIARTRVIAPYDGRVRSEKVDVGQFVNRGVSIATIYATDFAEVRLPIRDRELAFLNLSLVSSGKDVEAPARVILRARFAGELHEWYGEIVRTEGELDPRTRMVNVIASAAAPYAPSGSKPPMSVGLFVDAEIIGKSFPDIATVPRSALLHSGQQVYVIDGNNRLRSRDVEILRILEDEVYISGGLSHGDRVCISTLDSAVEGMRIRLENKTAVASS